MKVEGLVIDIIKKTEAMKYISLVDSKSFLSNKYIKQHESKNSVEWDIKNLVKE